jgi:hypothetical protein
MMEAASSAMPGCVVLNPACAAPSDCAAAPCPKDSAPSAVKTEGGTETRKAKRPRVAKTSSAGDAACAPECGEEDTKAPETGTWLIVAKAVRMHLKNNETSMHCGADALPALNAKLADMLRDAMQRAQCNGRKTLKGCDF